jgi:alginate O-acetyltransferase complex protein AlgI
VPEPGFADAWLAVLAYTVQIYFDFSAYSDMAIGLGEMMGFRFPENFRRPYHSRSVTEFWRRWHITLSSWLRDYLYIPLGGNRRGSTRTAVNLMTVMVLGGLWHGAAWTFVAWGAWHGAWLMAERVMRVRRGAPATPPVLGRLYTLMVVIVGWVFFRASSFDQGRRVLLGLVDVTSFQVSSLVGWQLSTGSIVALLLGMVVVTLEPRIFADGERRPVLLGALFLVAVARLLAASYSPFLYFQF